MNFPKRLLSIARKKGGWNKDLCRTGWRPCGARLAPLLERSLYWYGIHSQPTCQHQSVACLRPWKPSPLLFLEEWKVWYSPWMLWSTRHFKIAWERTGRSGCWPTYTPSLQVAVSAKWSCLRFARGFTRPGKTFQMSSIRSPFASAAL